MILVHLARFAPLLAALAWFRRSWPLAAALYAAFGASLLYQASPWEPLRWVSAPVGLVGAYVFGHGVDELLREWRIDVRITGRLMARELFFERLAGLPRSAWAGLLLAASSGGDAAALLAWRAWGEWVQPVEQIAVCVAIAALAVWPEKRR